MDSKGGKKTYFGTGGGLVLEEEAASEVVLDFSGGGGTGWEGGRDLSSLGLGTGGGRG